MSVTLPLGGTVLRVPHPVPTVDETLVQLLGATVFSKVDENSELWEIPLLKDSQHYTTIISSFGHYCFTTLPLGLPVQFSYFSKKSVQYSKG